MSQRTAIVDILRGWALLAVVLVNFAIFYSFGRIQRIPEGDWPSRAAKIFVQVMFQGKGWPALALLFGYGFSAWIAKTRARGADPAPGFIRRMLLLLVLGVVNCAFYYGDVLKDYALVGLVVLMFHRVTARTALTLGGCCLLAFPAVIAGVRSLGIESPVASPDIALYQSGDIAKVLRFGLQSGLNIALSPGKYADWNLVMLGCAFIGVFVQRSGLLERLPENLHIVQRIFWSALAFACAASLAVKRNEYYDIRFWPMLGQMAFFMAGICWLHVRGRFRKLFGAFQSVGRMTLTNYFVQNIVALLVFSGVGLGLLHRLSYSAHVAIAAALFAAQIAFSRFWLARHPAGPIEWLWRKLSAPSVIRVTDRGGVSA